MEARGIRPKGGSGNLRRNGVGGGAGRARAPARCMVAGAAATRSKGGTIKGQWSLLGFFEGCFEK
jgi:hypothetical protein